MEKKILVVDNNKMVLEFMSDVLSKEGHQVLTAEDGLSALGILKTFTPDIMFVDLIMPNIEGKKLCQIVRKMPELHNVYLVILSAVAVEEEIDLASLGVNAYIAKGPFKKMQKHVFDILDQSERTNAKDVQETIRGLEGIFPREITKELLSNKRHFEIVLGTMVEGILEITSDKRIVYANPAAISLIGIAEEKLLGKEVLDLFENSDREKVAGLLATIGAQPQASTDESLLNLNNKLVAVNIMAANSDTNKAIMILNDETERKRMEGHLLKSQKMEAIGTLVGGVAHDFNNILMAIVGNISLAQMHTTPGDNIFERLVEAEKACLRAKELTQKFMAFSEGERPVKKAGSVSGPLRDSVTLTLSGSNVRCDFSIASDLWRVAFDEGQMRRVFNNLITNAKEAMPKGGVVKVAAENIAIGEAEANARLPLKKGRHLKISIQDQGKGIPRERLSNIFDPYFSTKERGTQKGMGLGLSIAYSIIKQHDGYIEAASKEGVGTTFSLYLPVSEKQTSEKKEAEQIPPAHRGKILLMDDEKMVRDVTGQMLSRVGYEVAFAKDGTEAIALYAKAKNSGEPFKAVILDLTVPGGMGGKNTMEQLLEIDPGVKGIVSSGYNADPVMTDCRHYGFRAAIAKPYRFAELSKVLEEVIEKKG
jgi:two-component system cell cycle sensor histidine kinase/response regulator CckA